MSDFYASFNRAFHQENTLAYRWTQGIVWVLIFVSIALFAAEIAMPSWFPKDSWLSWVDRWILWFFVIELILRVVSYHPPRLTLFRRSPNWTLRTHILGRLRYCLKPLFLIDLLTVLALVPALRGLRALRLLRLLRSVRFFRYSNPILGVLRSFQENSLLYTATFSFLLLVVAVGGLSLYLTEVGRNPNVKTLADGFWWALVTLTTVGFGDISPQTGLGRIIGSVMMLIGMFMLALFAGIVSSTLLNIMLRLKEDQYRMSSYNNHIVVVGYDSGSELLLRALSEEAAAMQSELMVFAQGQRPVDLPDDFIWVSGEPTRESELDKLSLVTASSAILVGSRTLGPQQADAQTILTAFTIRSYLAKQQENQHRKKPLYLVAEILDTENVQHAKTAGADEVIESKRLGFSMMAHSAFAHGSGQIMSSVASAGAHSLFIGRYPFAEVSTYKTVAEYMRNEYEATVIGVQYNETGEVQFSLRNDHAMDDGQHVVYLASKPFLEPA